MASQAKCPAFFDGVYGYGWRPGIAVLIRKNIVESPLQRSDNPRVGIDRNIPLPEEKWADIVHSRGMVGVFMGKEDRIEAGYLVCEHLLAKIRAAIHHAIIPVVIGDHYRYTEPLVARVST